MELDACALDGGRQLGAARRDGQSCAYGPLGSVLIRDGIAEKGHPAVACIKIDPSAIFLDRRGAYPVKGLEDFTQFLGIEPLRERSRSDEVIGEGGDLPSFDEARQPAFWLMGACHICLLDLKSIMAGRGWARA
jgi:hypothetical protein